jgi:hypothetical protein
MMHLRCASAHQQTSRAGMRVLIAGASGALGILLAAYCTRPVLR